MLSASAAAVGRVAHHIGAGIQVRALHHERMQEEVALLERPLAPGELLRGEAAASAIVSGGGFGTCCDDLVSAVSLDPDILGYAMPVKRPNQKKRCAAAAGLSAETVATRREEALAPPSFESRATQESALDCACEAEADAPERLNSTPAAVSEGLGPQLMDVRRKLRTYLEELG